MPGLLETLAAKVALLHAGRVYAKFARSLEAFEASQQRCWDEVRHLLQGREQLDEPMHVGGAPDVHSEVVKVILAFREEGDIKTQNE